jgi:hypothetical protein
MEIIMTERPSTPRAACVPVPVAAPAHELIVGLPAVTSATAVRTAPLPTYVMQEESVQARRTRSQMDKSIGFAAKATGAPFAAVDGTAGTEGGVPPRGRPV